MKTPKGWKWYVVEYEHDGSNWTFDILARDDDDASRRVENLFNAKLLGQHVATIPAASGISLVVRLMCWVRNLFA